MRILSLAGSGFWFSWLLSRFKLCFYSQIGIGATERSDGATYLRFLDSLIELEKEGLLFAFSE